MGIAGSGDRRVSDRDEDNKAVRWRWILTGVAVAATVGVYWLAT